MRWLLVGSKGWIGQQVRKHLIELNPKNIVISIDEHFDSNASQKIRQLIQFHSPDRVFLCLGRAYLPPHRVPRNFTSGGISGTIDDLEHPAALPINLQDNLYLPIIFAEECRKLGIHMTYMGTGCIYEYDETHTVSNQVGFTEKDEPNYDGSAYSVVKSYTDRMMRDIYGTSCLTLRIRMPIVEDLHPRNFITKLLKYKTIVSRANSMTVLPELLPIAIKLAEKGTTGLLNLTNPGTMNHREILELVAQHWNIQLQCQFTEDDAAIQNNLRARRSNNCLDTTHLQQLCPSVKPLRDSMVWLLKEHPRPTEEQLRQLGYSAQ